jgi:hypothetical protein
MIILWALLALLCLVAGIIFMYYVRPPAVPQQSLSERIREFSEVDPNMGPLTAGRIRMKAERVISVTKPNLEAAQNVLTLQKQYEEAVRAEATAEPRLKQELLTFENQNHILERATAAGVPVQDYTKYMLKVLESQTELLKEAMSIRLTIDVAIATSDRHFALIQQLSGQIRQLRLSLHELKTEKQLPETVRETEVYSLEAQIKTLEARLSDHLKQTGVSEAHG